MSSTIHRIAGVLAVGAALSVPAAVNAASITTGVSAVKAHTDRADAALDRAVALYQRNADRRGAAQLSRSRKELGLATAAAAKLRRQADTDRERAAAARAQGLVGDQLDENVEQLVGLLDEVDGRVESSIAKAALADTRGREKAIAVLTAILGSGVTDSAAPGLTNALAALATDREDELEAEAEALGDEDVSTGSKRTVARSVKTSVSGQATASQRIAALLADPDMPAAAQAGLQRAMTEVAAEQGSVADILSRFSDRMPSDIREFVSAIVTRAREHARSMRENRPAPPAGRPDGTPAGRAPEGTPGEAPDGTPTGAAPEGRPSGAPEGTPSGAPSGMPGPPTVF